MNSPYMGKFRITQAYKGSTHDGLDLVGIDSKEIHATATGKVVFAGWENPNNHSQGFGQYVVILSGQYYYHYGHLSQIKVKYGDKVNCTDVIGIEGSTGCSTGSHCHYCIRKSMSRGTFVNVCTLSGIPNVEGGVYDDGYRPNNKTNTQTAYNSNIAELQKALNTKGCKLTVNGICDAATLAAARVQHINIGVTGDVVKWLQAKLNSLGFNCGAVDGIVGNKTMNAINAWQKSKGAGIGTMYGSDWDLILK